MIAGWDAPDDLVLPRLLRRQAGERPDGEFLRIGDGPAETFGQVLAAAERIAGRLAGLGVGRGDLVPLLADTSAGLVHARLGRPRDDLPEVRIVDPETDEVLPAGQAGEITVRPREPWVVMQGYLGMPDVTVAAWRNFRFHSGDFGYLTPDGYLYFAGRSGDRIRRRAENVPASVESAAVSHPRVQDCAAAGVSVRALSREGQIREEQR